MALKLFDKRAHDESRELALAKQKVKEKQKAFKDWQVLERAKALEEMDRKRAERDRLLAEQRTKNLEALKERREAAQTHAAAIKSFRQEKLRPYSQALDTVGRATVKGVTNVATGTLNVAHNIAFRSYVTPQYILGSKPNTFSPSYTALSNAFGGQPFTTPQAIQAVMNSLNVNRVDALARLHRMKQLGMIQGGRY